MKNLNIKFLNYFAAFLMALLLPLSACDDDNDAEPSNGDGDDNGIEKWEPYDFQDHTSTTLEYEFEFEEDGETVLSGTSTIEIEDPTVTLTVVMNGEESVFSSDSYDNVEDNFNEVVNEPPFIGSVLFGNSWPAIFEDQELYVGASWSMNFGGDSVDLEITGKETYAGMEGYVAEYTLEYEDGDVVTYTICVDPEVPLPLMVELDEEGAYYHLALTNYENE